MQEGHSQKNVWGGGGGGDLPIVSVYITTCYSHFYLLCTSCHGYSNVGSGPGGGEGGGGRIRIVLAWL